MWSLCRVWAGAVDAGNQHYRAADVMNTEQVDQLHHPLSQGREARHVGEISG